MVFEVGQSGFDCHVCKFLHLCSGNMLQSVQCFKCNRWFHSTSDMAPDPTAVVNAAKHSASLQLPNNRYIKEPKDEEVITCTDEIADEPLLKLIPKHIAAKRKLCSGKVISSHEVVVRICANPTDVLHPESGYSSKISSPTGSTMSFCVNGSNHGNELDQEHIGQPDLHESELPTKRKRRNKNSACGECSQNFRDIETEDLSVQCDVCLLWFCGRCVPPESYNDSDPYLCFLCSKTYDDSEKAAAKIKKKRQGELGPILCCNNEWCSYYVQVDARNGTSLKKAQFILKKHTQGCERQFKKGKRHLSSNKPGNKYVAIKKHGLGFGTTKMEKFEDGYDN